jgi:REP-associated tyrosine transposase
VRHTSKSQLRRATGGLATIPRCLTVDEILAYFGQRRGPAQQKYRSYVTEGVNGTTIWENLEAQSLLGLEGFADALRGHVTSKQNLREIPKGQRLIGRPRLDKLFEGRGKKKTAGNRTVRI